MANKANITGCYLAVAALSMVSINPARSAGADTFANPLNLSYRFQLDLPSRREAADPTMVYFKGEWWLFASKSGGYWHTKDFKEWDFVEPTGLPLENYAPTVEMIGSQMYFSAGGGAIYSTDDPLAGLWTKVANMHDAPDIDLFRDDDNRVYVYYGCSDQTPIYGEELDPSNGFKTIRGPVALITQDREHHGWEVHGKTGELTGTPTEDASDQSRAPWIEGSWMNKVGGRYYLQYAAPGTEFDGYADGVYVGDNPLGPFKYSEANPVSFRPTGFATGAGHGSTFKDKLGNYWHIATEDISVRHVFERRVGMFPAKFFPDGQMAVNTYLGDYPQYLPGTKHDPFDSNSPGWMLLTLNKPAEASSSLAGHPANLAFDESIKTWWSAQTGNKGEWLKVDLGAVSTINALQINFADEGSTALGSQKSDAYQYLVEVSSDGQNWQTVADERNNQRDAPQDYIQLPHSVDGRYVRLTNFHTPAGALFSVSGLRVFGKAPGDLPALVRGIGALRQTDRRRMHVSWTPAKGAEFYIVRYGIRPDRLFNNYQVYGATELEVTSLNTDADDFVSVDAVNSSGVTHGVETAPVMSVI